MSSATATPANASWTMKANKGGDFEKAPAGNHPAVLIGIVDLGNQWTDFQGQGKFQHRALFVWELVSEKASNGKNFVIGIDLTLSFNEKSKLRKWVEARTGKQIPEGSEFNITSELGQGCLLNVIEKNGYPKIDGVTAMPKGFPTPKPQNEPFAWSLAQYDAATGSIPLPSWVPYLYGSPITEHIKASREIAGEAGAKRGVSRSSAPAQVAPTSGPQRPSGGPPKMPAMPKAESADDSMWAWCVDGAANKWATGTAKDLKNWMEANKTGAGHVFVTPAGKEDMKLASDHGFSEVPF